MDFFGTPIIGLCPDLFFFSGEVGEVVGNLENWQNIAWQDIAK